MPFSQLRSQEADKSKVLAALSQSYQEKMQEIQFKAFEKFNTTEEIAERAVMVPFYFFFNNDFIFPSAPTTDLWRITNEGDFSRSISPCAEIRERPGVRAG